ncbi:MAG TPA: hypothetical protein VGN12_06315 [Pirellulales bacterium]|jgi:hypothetical protein
MPQETPKWLRADHKNGDGRSLLSEGERFAQILLGRTDDRPTAWFLERKPSERETLEFLARFSTEHRAQLERLNRLEAEAARRQGQSRCDAFGMPIAEWNEGDHPRTGTAPNPGWFASKGGGTGGAAARHGNGMFNVKDDRSQTKIEQASGKNWHGDTVLGILSTVQPDVIPFIKKHVTLARNSSGERTASTVVRSGEAGPEATDISDATANEHGHLIAHFHVPDDWDDLQVAQYILEQLADHSDVYRMVSQWAQGNPKILESLRQQRFRQGLKDVKALVEGYYTALAGLAPGGGAVVATWDIRQGNYLGAALGMAFSLPLGRILKAGVESTGTIAIRAGDKLIAAIPVKAIKFIEKMPVDQRRLLNAHLREAKSADEAAAIVTKFIGGTFHKHHPLPRFLGGDLKQLLSTIPKAVHDEFHAELRHELRASGFKLPIGSVRGSAAKWKALFASTPGSQGRAFDAVIRTSQRIDKRHKTSITKAVLKNLTDENAAFFP